MKRTLALLLSCCLLLALFAACSASPSDEGTSPTPTENTPAQGENTPAAGERVTPEIQPPAEWNDTPLVVGYSEFSAKFSPFYAETSYDVDATSMTQIGLLTTDRQGNIIYNAIEGETHNYNGTDYLYQGPANLDVNYDEAADKTTYLWTLRDDLWFSDGKPVTADDVIFSYYVYCDPAYSGSSTIAALDIVGLSSYRTQTTPEIAEKYNAVFAAIYEGGAAGTEVNGVAITQEMIDYVFAPQPDSWWEEFATAISAYCRSSYVSYSELPVDSKELLTDDKWLQVLGMELWGFGTLELTEDGAEIVSFTGSNGKVFTLTGTDFPTAADYADCLKEAYNNNAFECYVTEDPGTPDIVAQRKLAFVIEYGSQDPAMAGATFPNIEGIKKLNDYQVEVTVNGFDAAAVYRMGIEIAPLHYYGDAALYDYDNNKFGFPFGDLSNVESKTAAPMGAGPYQFIKYENKIVYYEANLYYYKGTPLTRYLQFKTTIDPDKVTGIGTGAIDITDPSFSVSAIAEISSYNSNGELVGDTIRTNTVDFLGYGYIGINAMTVNVGGDWGSDASKNLRKGLATVLAAYRDLTVDSYYGERASVINYPISNTSWAAPQKTDQGYKVAYSVDVDGNDIFRSDMTPDERYEAAIAACVGYLKAAGYTFDDASGKFTAAPDGASLEYEVIIPGNGVGNHPSFKLLDGAKTSLATIGISLIINDPADSNVLWDALDAESQELWCAAWGATIDPDMYQVYYSDNTVSGDGPSESNHYHITDDQLDEVIWDARKSDDNNYRKALYKTALEIIMEWGVEIPIYQRQDCVIFSEERVDFSTITPDITTFWGWARDIQNVRMK